MPDSVAKKNLRQTIYMLRQILGDNDDATQPFLIITRQTVQFNAATDASLDVDQFLTALAEGDLPTAVSLYHNDLLTGYICDSPAFEEWLQNERERLRTLALGGMEKLGARYLRNGRVEDAQAVARQQIALAPWSETAYQQLIEALALAGNRAAALAQFEQLQEILADELGVSPSNGSFDLIARIEKGELQPIDPDLIAGRYSLGDEIGRGAMGTVYRGLDSWTGEAVAIKLLSEDKSSRNPDLVTRFIREGEALQQLNHPNIVKLLATDERNGRYYLIMEYIVGGVTTKRPFSR